MTNPANNANTPPDADPQADKPAGQEPPQAETDSTDDDDVEASSEAVSFDERRRRASDRKSSSHPTANVWQHFAKQRQAAAKAAKLDIGYHRPTMEQLAPVLLLAERQPTVVQTERDRYTDAKAEQRQSSLDRGFDRHATLNESATAHFLRKPPALK
ncbi:unnamed protein product, partial [Aphanomyces euteiches]